MDPRPLTDTPVRAAAALPDGIGAAAVPRADATAASGADAAAVSGTGTANASPAATAMAARALPLPAPWRGLVLAALLALIVVGLAWETVVAPTGRGTLALKVLPLVAVVPGVWRGRVGTARWLSLLVWLYFIEAVVRAWGDRGASQVAACVSLALVLMLFGAVVGGIRAGRRDRAATPVPASTVGPVPAPTVAAAERR